MKKLTLFFVVAMLLIVFSLQAFTDSGWSSVSTVNNYGIKYNVWTVTITTTTADTNAYTAITPINLDTSREWELLLNTNAVSTDGAATPVDLMYCWSGDAAMSGDGTLTTTDCAEEKTITSTIDAVCEIVCMDPNLTTADVTNERIKVSKAPYYIINIDSKSALEAAVVVIKIVQMADGY